MPRWTRGNRQPSLRHPTIPTICLRSFSYLKLVFTWRLSHLPPVILSFILFFGPFSNLSANYYHRFFGDRKRLLPSQDTGASPAYFSQWNLPTAGQFHARNRPPRSSIFADLRETIPNYELAQRYSYPNGFSSSMFARCT